MNKILESAGKIFFKILLAIFCLVVYLTICAGLINSFNSPLAGLLLALATVILIASFKKLTNRKIRLKNIIFSVSIVFLICFILGVFSSLHSQPAPGLYDLNLKSSFRDLKTASAVYYKNSSDSYIGFGKDSEYIAIREEIDNHYVWFKAKNYYSDQIREDAFCAKDKLFTEDVYWCVDSKGKEIEATDQYCTAEKPYCAE